MTALLPDPGPAVRTAAGEPRTGATEGRPSIAPVRGDFASHVRAAEAGGDPSPSRTVPSANPPAAGLAARLAAHPAGSPEQKAGELRRAAVLVESLLLKELVHGVMAGGGETGLFGEGNAGETWQALFETNLSETLAANGTFGLSRDIVNQYERERAGEITIPGAQDSALPADLKGRDTD